VIESEMPLRVEKIALRMDGHGHGLFRGGCGIRRDVRVLESSSVLSVLSDRNMIPPYGVAGASSGEGNRFDVLREGESVKISPIPGKVAAFALKEGDLVRMETAGGGGWGDPAEREPASVAADVAMGVTSQEVAAECYGVVLAQGGAVDHAATARRRQQIRHARTMLRVEAGDSDEHEGARRIFGVSHATAQKLGITEGQLCEIVNPAGPSLRGWARVRPTRPDDSLVLGPFGRSILRCKAGDRFELRRIG
jgi:N-methylhydantoinase B